MKTQSILPPEFVEKLQAQARRYQALQKLTSRREWYFGELVNCAWETLPDDIKAELTHEHYYMECSRVINEACEFPIVTHTGETLRRWCEIAASYQNMPALEEIREVLSFDHFVKARRLVNRQKIAVPSLALATAIEQEYTADEMVQHFDPPQPPNEYERVTGWLDSLQAARWSWLDRDRQTKVNYHLEEIRKILS